jgi:hypothetical protein
MKLFLKDFTSIKVTINTKQIVFIVSVKTFSKFIGGSSTARFREIMVFSSGLL